MSCVFSFGTAFVGKTRCTCGSYSHYSQGSTAPWFAVGLSEAERSHEVHEGRPIHTGLLEVLVSDSSWNGPLKEHIDAGCVFTGFFFFRKGFP